MLLIKWALVAWNLSIHLKLFLCPNKMLVVLIFINSLSFQACLLVYLFKGYSQITEVRIQKLQVLVAAMNLLNHKKLWERHQLFHFYQNHLLTLINNDLQVFRQVGNKSVRNKDQWQWQSIFEWNPDDSSNPSFEWTSYIRN